MERLNFLRVDDGRVGISFVFVAFISETSSLCLSLVAFMRASSSLGFEEFPVRVCSEGTFFFPHVFGNVLRSIIINLFLSSLPPSSSSSSSSLLQVCFVLVFLFLFAACVLNLSVFSNFVAFGVWFVLWLLMLRRQI